MEVELGGHSSRTSKHRDIVRHIASEDRNLIGLPQADRKQLTSSSSNFNYTPTSMPLIPGHPHSGRAPGIARGTRLGRRVAPPCCELSTCSVLARSTSEDPSLHSAYLLIASGQRKALLVDKTRHTGYGRDPDIYAVGCVRNERHGDCPLGKVVKALPVVVLGIHMRTEGRWNGCFGDGGKCCS